ncbi:two-component response regulator-like APRR5 isoform X2 [Punica granatum]|uniref:Two-component response regulator-like APRR5 isoform X2 n=1 Tax=Punica granatum TaxID=22663 RepID=A0A6P8DF03_PUNGR|nr:two-component response regulator-like APRR5 isoform X2 [Punica granatum]
MGEVVLSSSDTAAEAEAEVPATAEGDAGGERRAGVGSPTGVVKWERFLPRMVLRVLLVEADDSTRQIIAALLRKCSYRVAAVPDGLKAWELLKGRPRNIDLILTEVDLPSISGYALLTLIMEHDICKNIPVIMMSSQDSISTVYKCMMRGAADYLVKPIRRNELKNLWQHVWRRQSSTSGSEGGQDDNVALQKVEATAENNAASNHSSGYMACLDRDKELIEKGSDAQSSCTKPDVEVDVAEVQQKQDSHLNEAKILTPENIRSSQEAAVTQDKTSDAVAESSHVSSQSKHVNPEIHERDAKVATVGCGGNVVTVNSYGEAINLIGAFDNHNRSSYMDSSSNYATRKSDISPELDLSLRRSESCFTSQRTEERHTLKHSDASAFSRYVNKPLRPVPLGLANLPSRERDCGRNPDDNVSCAVKSHNLDNRGLAQASMTNIMSLANAQSGQSEYVPSRPQQLLPAPIPVRGLRFENLSTEYSSMYPQAYCAQSGPSPVPSPSEGAQREPFLRVDSFQQSTCENNTLERVRDTPDPNVCNSSNQSRQNQNHDFKFDSVEDRGHISPATDKSASSSLCNGGALTHLHSMDCGSICGSNGNVNQVPITRHAGESRPVEESSQRSIQREAALAKFRLKRKDRCYEKKVRYESRKKLAEQRPRVKGQFVRQAQSDPATEETNP